MCRMYMCLFMYMCLWLYVVVCFPVFEKKIKDHKKYKIPKKSFLDVSQEAKKKCFFFPLLLNSILIYIIY